MTDDQIKATLEEGRAVQKSITVNCDEYHAHSAFKRGCVEGSTTPEKLLICKLTEIVAHLMEQKK